MQATRSVSSASQQAARLSRCQQCQHAQTRAAAPRAARLSDGLPTAQPPAGRPRMVPGVQEGALQMQGRRSHGRSVPICAPLWSWPAAGSWRRLPPAARRHLRSRAPSRLQPRRTAAAPNASAIAPNRLMLLSPIRDRGHRFGSAAKKSFFSFFLFLSPLHLSRSERSHCRAARL